MLIFNSGWSEGTYEYVLQDGFGFEIISSNVMVDSFSNAELTIDVSNLPSSTYTLIVFPAHAPEKLQTIVFNLHSSVVLGDMNGDSYLNVLDIVILSNLILSGDNSNPAGDLNQDGNQNILDIVSLVNIIIT